MSEPERDPELERLYRELKREEPPPALDAGIRAAARREAESRPAPLVAPPARRRWYLPLAAAAVIMLSVAVTLNLQRAEPDPELGMPGNPPPRPEAAPVSRAPAAPKIESVASDASLAARPSAESAMKPADVESSPEAWLAHIAELRREGRHALADESYAAFRRRYPGYRIPEAMRDRVLPR